MKTNFNILFAALLIISITSKAQESSADLAAKIEAMAKVGACYSPSFSPDGSEVAFITNMSGSPQLWKMSTAGGWPIQLTNFNDPVSNASWSPKGNKIVFQLAPGGGMNSQVYTINSDGTQVKKLTVGGQTNNWVGIWSKDGRSLSFSSNMKNPAGMDSYLYDFATNSAKLIVKNQGTGRITDMNYENTEYLVNRVASRGSNDIYLVDQESNETLLTKHDGPGTFFGSFAPNNDIYMASNLGRDKVAFGRLINGNIKIISDHGDSELEKYVFNKSGSMAFLIWNTAGKNEVTLFDIESQKELRTINMPVELLRGVEFSADDRYFLFTGAGSTEPANVWLYDLPNDEFRKLTDSQHPGVDLKSLIAPELVKFNSFDGLELSGWLYTPKGEGPYPTVISYHGGPEGQSQPSFNYTFQALLSQGIAVFSPNVRGSSGFGKTFVNLDNGALRVNGIKDIEACYNYVVESGFADKSKVGIMGGSYGGYMVMAGITEYPDMFAAGANLFGVVNFITFFEETEPWMAAISKVEYGDPDKESEMLKALSPINKVDAVKTPTIVLHGANDTNVPVVEAEQVVQNLKQRDIPVEYILFEDEGHGWRKTSNKVTSTVSIVKWFKTYLLE